MANTRSKSSSSKIEVESPQISLEVVKELLTVQEKTIKSFFSTFMEANDKRHDNLLKEIQSLRTSLEYTQAQLKEVIDLKMDVELKDIKCTIEKVKEKTDDLENRSRRNNLCFDGIDEFTSETWKQTEEKVKDVIKNRLEVPQNVVIERAHRVGAKREGKTRSIVAKFLNYKDREDVFKAKRKLKGTGIFVREDLSERVQAKRKELMPKLTEARNNGKIAYFSYDKLIIKDRPFLGHWGRYPFRNKVASLLIRTMSPT